MTITKTVGALCGSLLVFLLGSWVAESLFHVGGGYGYEARQAYTIDTGADDAPAEEVAEVPFAELYAAADPAAGERVWAKCRACHKLEAGANAAGPYLHGVVGRAVDAASGFGYSGALEKVVDVWTPEHLNAFLENPKAYTPGTAMAFSGLPKAEERANLIAFLATFK